MTEQIPIPASCAARPVRGGLVVPHLNVVLADGTVDFRTPHGERYEQVWRQGRCQTCAHRLGDLAVFFGGPNQLADLAFDEPPLCPPCALYASQACPMVAGRRDRYAASPRITEGHRGDTCTVPGCGCAGWVQTFAGRAEGSPAHPWYAVYARAGTWQVTAVQTDKPGYAVPQIMVTGGRLIAPPVRVVHVSEPGQGRIWKRIVKGDACPASTS